MRQKLTVLIPCRNECDNIRACIESARLVADEILVADSGSTDGTLETLRTIPDCKVISREWNGYAAFKNWAIPQAAHPWVLIVDADERVTPQLAEEIRNVLGHPSDRIDGYRIRHRAFFLGHELKYSGRNTTSACRLIRRDVCRYKNVRVHEEIDVMPKRVGRLREKFIHYEYRCYDHYFSKRLRYTQLGAEDRWQSGQRTGLVGLLISPVLRFLHLYLVRLGCLDGLAGLQICMLTAFFNTFVKQARLWEKQHAVPQEVVERSMGTLPAAGEDTSPAESPTPDDRAHVLSGDPPCDESQSLRAA